MLMVSRMVNMVGEQGTYRVANNFIWGWMLLPVTQLGELFKQEVARDKSAIKKNTPGYFFATGIIVLLWIVLIPAYKPFMKKYSWVSGRGQAFWSGYDFVCLLISL